MQNWFLPLNLVLSTNFGRLAQRQSIGLTLRNSRKFQTHTNLQLINIQRLTAGSRKSSLTSVAKRVGKNGTKMAQAILVKA